MESIRLTCPDISKCHWTILRRVHALSQAEPSDRLYSKCLDSLGRLAAWLDYYWSRNPMVGLHPFWSFLIPFGTCHFETSLCGYSTRQIYGSLMTRSITMYYCMHSRFFWWLRNVVVITSDLMERVKIQISNTFCRIALNPFGQWILRLVRSVITPTPCAQGGLFSTCLMPAAGCFCGCWLLCYSTALFCIAYLIISPPTSSAKDQKGR